MANIAKVTELDFDTIKKNLKDYFNRPDSPFRDWDFQGSGLNYLLDILAYNTHYNAVNAHLSMNESFLDSAQLRSNVVSRAKLISYTPRSRRGARAVVKLDFARAEGGPETLTLLRGTTFSTSIDGETYIFTTREDYETVFNTATNLYTFDRVTLVQGALVSRSYIVDSSVVNQRFKIDDENIDTSTMDVVVQDNSSTTAGTTYLNGDLFTSYDPESLVYFLSESYEGKYQIEFGDGIIGKKLNNLSIVNISFLSSAGEIPNGARLFKFIRTPNQATFAVNASLRNLETVEASYGGDERESIEDIRQVAPYTFIAQNRAVTNIDYQSLVKSNIPDVDAISVWGGQDNDPPIYGKVFISIKPNDAFLLTEAQREEVIAYLNRVKILTVKPEIVDPNYIYLFFDVFFKYNPNLTTLSRTQLESNVRNTIAEFNELTLGGFDKIFRYSKFLSAIDSTETSILNSFSRIYVYKTIELNVDNRLPLSLDFKLKMFGDINQKESIISSSSWKYNNQSVYFGDEPIENSETLRSIYVYRLSSTGEEIKIFSNIGTLNIFNGKITLEPIQTTFNSVVEISCIPDSYDIATIRNQLLTIDMKKVSISGDDEDFNSSVVSERSYNPISRFR